MSAMPDSTFVDPKDRLIADLQRQLAASDAKRDEALAERDKALAQQAATAEVLQLINRSPGDLAPVFEAILEKALRLCEADFGGLITWDGQRMHRVAARGLSAELMEALHWKEPQTPQPGSVADRLIRGEDVISIADLAEEGLRKSPHVQTLARVSGARSYLALALRRDERLLGIIAIHRNEVRPFTDKQIALLQNFAAQAVIAMENARLITETREALEQQTATAEVLQVINASPGDLKPVFEALLERALATCGGTYGGLLTFDGERFHAVASRGHAEFDAWAREYGPVRPAAGSQIARIVAGEDAVQLTDIANDDVYRKGAPPRRAMVEIGGFQTLLSVALRRDNTLLGVLQMYRQEARPFSDKQIALLQNFAAQAVIAMENARLITETREALEQQTATAEVFGVINSSPGDLAPVFDAMLEKAMHLCEADEAALRTFDGELLHLAAMHGSEPDIVARLRQLGPTRAFGLYEPFAHGERVAHYPDVRELAVFRDDPVVRQRLKIHGIRTWLGVALQKDGVLLGVINVHRHAVKPFTAKQIALLQNFAAQAAIAMENARLITETREALDQQTATAEVLQVINASPGDLKPVFDAMLDKAMRLCGAAYGILMTYDGECFEVVAVRGGRARVGSRNRPQPGFVLERLVGGEPTVHVTKAFDDPAYHVSPAFREMVDVDGVRTMLVVSLRKEDGLLGAIGIYSRDERPFSEKQIALLQSFAAQAVIAMDNARLLDEIRQRQAELRVTFDNMGDGVAMFDGDQRLAAWNLNFQRILDLPDALLDERPRIADFVHYLARHGEYGVVDVETEARRLSERVGTQWSSERTRPDGRVIEVRSNPVPGGGVVLIYSDITERKRAEAEIRAARDTAEKALQELQATQASLLHAQKMASLGQLTAGIAHEIKNPLNFVNNFAGLSIELLDELKESAAPGIAMLDDDTRAEIDETVEMLTSNLDKIAEHGKRADNIVKSMLEHSRGVSGERREVDLNALVDEALNLAYHGARAQDQSFNITLERDYQPGLAPIECAPQEITRVFLNLFSNGFYAATKRAYDNGDAAFRPTLAVVTREAGDVVEIKVRDNGSGIPPEIKDRLFQPFFTTKPTGEGTGLGLSISYDIITQQHGGTITVDSEPGAFTEFTIRLPRRVSAGRAA